ncbi:MAG: GTPase ObgE [Culicoidibacterales bacterium]
MFIDQVKIYVKGGDGGNGMVAFRREKYVDLGGPAGGNGGNGGHVIFQVDEGLRTLMDFRYNKKFMAPDGGKGLTKGCHGANADDLVLLVPPGTTVFDNETNLVIADLIRHGDRAIIAKGGRAGRGNMSFATHKNPAPSIAEKGEPGQERELRLELKLLADAGLVGFPSVGKSTILAHVSAAKPKIAAYHFTTITPNIGVVATEDRRSFVLADLPGLIEGAHAGHGLGQQFLRHIERTRVIIHVIDMGGTEGRDPYEDYVTINNELSQYRYQLMERPMIVVANKMDEPMAEENLARFREQVGPDVDIFPVIAELDEGLAAVMDRTMDLIETTPDFPIYSEEEIEEVVVYKYRSDEEGFTISKGNENVGTRTTEWILGGDRLEKLFKMTNFDHEESVERFARTMRLMGVDQGLRDRGAKNGDSIWILDYEFEFLDEE